MFLNVLLFSSVLLNIWNIVNNNFIPILSSVIPGSVSLDAFWLLCMCDSILLIAGTVVSMLLGVAFLTFVLGHRSSYLEVVWFFVACFKLCSVGAQRVLF